MKVNPFFKFSITKLKSSLHSGDIYIYIYIRSLHIEIKNQRQHESVLPFLIYNQARE